MVYDLGVLATNLLADLRKLRRRHFAGVCGVGGLGWGGSAGVHRGGVSAPRGVAAPFDLAMHLLQLSRCWAECLGL